MFEQYLQEIGLSEKEARIYLALLQVDRNTVQELATRTNINRTTVYPVLESLQKKGLVSEIQEGKKIEYMSEPPERLETFAERQRVVFEEHAARLKDIIPQIKSIQREQGERPVVKYFEGRDGAISAYEEFYGFDPDVQEEGYFVFNRDLLRNVFTEEELQKFLDIREKKKLLPTSVYNYIQGDYPFTTKGIKRTRIDEKKYPIKCDISVVRDRVVITTLGEKVSGFLIASKDIADTLKSLVKKINE
jgi:HTH-type transcriptional regulator, sugar sensing transcriptional regulator